MQNITLPADSPARAAFIMDGTYMAPWVKQGELVTVEWALPAVGQCGLFQAGDTVVFRQYCEDSFGNIYLFVLNRAFRDMDITVPRDTPVRCLGRAMLDKTPPLPMD